MASEQDEHPNQDAKELPIQSQRSGVYHLKRDEQGNEMFEAESAKEINQTKTLTNPATGTESQEPWPKLKEEKAYPLLDLTAAWKHAVQGIPIEREEGEKEVEGDSVFVQNAKILIMEFKYYVLAQTFEERGHVKEPKDPDSLWHAEIPNGENQESEEEEEDEIEKKHADTDKDDELKSVYGANVMFKLRWEDRTVQKIVPRMNYEQLASFIEDIHCRLKAAFDSNMDAAQLITDYLAMDMTPMIFARYLDGLETETASLAEACYDLLSFCANNANPKEMHLGLRGFLSKIDSVYFEATSYLSLTTLMDLWKDILPRLPRKRLPFFTDVIKDWERLYACAETYNVSFVPDKGLGVERPGRLDRFPDTVLDLLEGLIEAQKRQRDTDEHLRIEVDVLGRPIVATTVQDEKAAEMSAASDSNGPNEKNTENVGADKKGGGSQEKSGFEKKAAITLAREDTKEWVRERATILARSLQLLNLLFARLPLPSGDDRNVPRRRLKMMKKRQKKETISDEEKEKALQRCINLFPGLGWDNPITVCQVATNGLELAHADSIGLLMKEHIGTDMRSKKEKKNTLYSITGVGMYLCGVVREWTYAAKGTQKQRIAPDEIDLDGTVFDFVEPLYALQLVVPFLMPIVCHSSRALAVNGVLLLRALLRRIPDNSFENLDEMLRLCSATTSSSHESSIFGLSHVICRSIEGFEDPKHRRMAYECVQYIARKCRCPSDRYAAVVSLHYGARRQVVAAQMLNELKNVMMYSDACAENDNEEWTVRDSSKLRTRFLEDCATRTFTPRKDMLSTMSQLSTAAPVMYFLVKRDEAMKKRIGESDADVLEDLEKRKRMYKAYLKLGKECVRALGSVAEHDRKNIPSSKLATKNKEDAIAVYQASGKTLNQCVGAISFLDAALQSEFLQ